MIILMSQPNGKTGVAVFFSYLYLSHADVQDLMFALHHFFANSLAIWAKYSFCCCKNDLDG